MTQPQIEPLADTKPAIHCLKTIDFVSHTACGGGVGRTHSLLKICHILPEKEKLGKFSKNPLISVWEFFLLEVFLWNWNFQQ